MNFNKFLNKVIDNGIAAAKKDYTSNDEKRNGSIAGFDACRDKTHEELLEVWQDSLDYVEEARKERSDNYWWFRCYQLEVEWVLNVVSVVLVNEGQEPLLNWLPTANAYMAADKVLKELYEK